MSSCGGTVTTQTISLGAQTIQLVSALEQRTRVTIRAAWENDNPVFITGGPSVGYRQGFPLYPGDAYQLDAQGARVALYGIGPFGGDKTVFVITEGE